MLRKAVNIKIGQRFGKWIVLKLVQNYRNRSAWLCQCDCGSESRALEPYRLVSGESRSCCGRARPTVELKGKKIGSWTVLKRTKKDKRGNFLWLCQCKCGSKPREVGATFLKNKRSLSCRECAKIDKSIKPGQKYNMLTTLKFVGVSKKSPNSNHSVSMWLCRCDCGKKKVALGFRLKDGHIKSCGCVKFKAIDIGDMRKCTECGEIKLLDKFKKGSGTKGRNHRCKKCDNEISINRDSYILYKLAQSGIISKGEQIPQWLIEEKRQEFVFNRELRKLKRGVKNGIISARN